MRLLAATIALSASLVSACAAQSASEAGTAEVSTNSYGSAGGDYPYANPSRALDQPMQTQSARAEAAPAPMPIEPAALMTSAPMADEDIADMAEESADELVATGRQIKHESAPPPPPSAGASSNLDRTRAQDEERAAESADDHRKSLIYEATVQLGVFETNATIDAAETLARDAGGYLVHRDDQRITFRVPSAKFYPTLEAVLKLGDVLHREVNVRDVTEEFRDLRVRLRNAEAVRDRLETLLARADKVDQALEVQRELARVAGEIEQIKGRLSLLQELTSYSTITLQFQPRHIDVVESQVHLPFPWLDELGLPELLAL